MKKHTVIIGIGGVGCSVADSFAARCGGDGRVFSLLFDTDADALARTTAGERFDLSSAQSFRSAAERLSPDSEIAGSLLRALLSSPDMRHGAGLCRLKAVTALAAFLAGDGRAQLDARIAQIADASDGDCEIYLVAALTGGTGSGLLLPLARYFAHELSGRGVTASIYALLLLPDATGYLSAGGTERVKQGGNAYATLRELDAVAGGKNGKNLVTNTNFDQKNDVDLAPNTVFGEKDDLDLAPNAPENAFFGRFYSLRGAETDAAGLFSQIYLVDKQLGVGNARDGSSLAADILALLVQGLPEDAKSVGRDSGNGGDSGDSLYTLLSLSAARLDRERLGRELAARAVCEAYSEQLTACRELLEAADESGDAEAPQSADDELRRRADDYNELLDAAYDRFMRHPEPPCGDIGARMAECRGLGKRRKKAELAEKISGELEQYRLEQRTSFCEDVRAAAEKYMSQAGRRGETVVGLSELLEQLLELRAELRKKTSISKYRRTVGESVDGYLSRSAAASEPSELDGDNKKSSRGRRNAHTVTSLERTRAALTGEWETRRRIALRVVTEHRAGQFIDACRALLAALEEGVARLESEIKQHNDECVSCTGHAVLWRCSGSSRIEIYERQRDILRGDSRVGAQLPEPLLELIASGDTRPDHLRATVDAVLESEAEHVRATWEGSGLRQLSEAGLIGLAEQGSELGQLMSRLSYRAELLTRMSDGVETGLSRGTRQLIVSSRSRRAAEMRTGADDSHEALSRLLLDCGCLELEPTDSLVDLPEVGDLLCVERLSVKDPFALRRFDKREEPDSCYRDYLQCLKDRQKYDAPLWYPHLPCAERETSPRPDNTEYGKEKIC